VNAAEVVENKYSARVWQRFSNHLENVLINYVKRFMLILIVGFRLISIQRSPEKFKRDITPRPLNGRD